MTTTPLSAEALERALELCKKWDTDSDGAINRAELNDVIRDVLPESTDEDISLLLASVDMNGDGVIHYIEFLEWMQLPVDEKLSFEDTFKILPTEMIAQEEVLEQSSQGAIEPSPMVRQSSSRKSPEGTILESFTHPLLSVFSVINSNVGLTEPSEEKNDVIHVSTVSIWRSGRKERAGAVVVKDNNGNFVMKVNVIPRFGRVCSEAEYMYTMVRGYSEVYIGVLKAFCNSLCEPGGLLSTAVLQLRPLPVINESFTAVPSTPDLEWSGISLALAQLSPAEQRKLSHARVQISVHAEELGNMSSILVEKQRLATVPLLLQEPGHGAPFQRNGGFDWLMFAKDVEARFHRLHIFMLTQRAVFGRCFELDKTGTNKKVELHGVDEMISGTRLHKVAANAKPTQIQDLLRTPYDVGWKMRSDPTVIELSQFLAAQGKKVAAVNAASAFHVGGGASSGGRHALEEAWCTVSTLYASLNVVKAGEPFKGIINGESVELHQHIPTLKCLVSPDVEIFRGQTTDGYGFMSETTRLCGVISVAMFNCNPNITDSPLDSPSDRAAYIAQTQTKLEAVVTAAVELGAEALVIPSLGCGVFRNDPLVVGGCLGHVLGTHAGGLKEVVLVGNATFVSACYKAFRGEDPREVCPDGAACKRRDAAHVAQFIHKEPGLQRPSESLESTLLAFTESVTGEEKPKCCYGAACHIKNPQHLENFSHPEFVSVDPVMPHWLRGSSSSESSDKLDKLFGWAHKSRNPFKAQGSDFISKIGEVAAKAREKLKPVCKFGEHCYNNDPRHLSEFSHPSLDAESPARAKERAERGKEHELLDFAKNMQWQIVKDILQKQPELVNVRPASRSFALVHFAACQGSFKTLDWLVQHGGDLTSKTRDGESVEKILDNLLQRQPPEIAAQRQKYEDLRQWVRKKLEERVAIPNNQKPPLKEVMPDVVSSTELASFVESASMEDSMPHVLERADAEPSAHTEESPPERATALETITVSTNTEGLKGNYVRLPDSLNGCPVYQKKDDGMTTERRYLHFSRNPAYGWVIDEDLTHGGIPCAYLGPSKQGRSSPCVQAPGEFWKVYLDLGTIPGLFSPDHEMRVQLAQ